MFRPMKPETVARRAAEWEVAKRERRVNLIARLQEKAGEVPAGEHNLWAEMLEEMSGTDGDA